MTTPPAVPGMAVHSTTTPDLTGHISAQLAAGYLGVITPEGYHPVRPEQIVVDGPHPTEWDRHETVRR